MILLQLNGGLGNQMFQYAAGKSLAVLRGTELKLDLSWFDAIGIGTTPRQYELACFQISATIAAPQELKIFKPSHWQQFWNKYFSSNRKPIYTERHFRFDPQFFNLGAEVYLKGYFQSEKYFKQIEGIIRQEFSFKTPPTGKNQELAELIQTVNSVSLHIRRGDYVTNTETNRFHGVCGLDYYQKAAAEIQAKIQNPHFFIFSDDPVWVRENLQIKAKSFYLDQNQGVKSWEDLRLMSLCRHNILANSSFSWWGAWLNRNADKIVIAPKQWFASTTHNTQDLIPEEWERI